MGWIISILGIGGVAALGAVFFPALTAKIAFGALELALRCASWVFATFMDGLTKLLSTGWTGMFALVLIIGMSGVAGDKFDWVRPYVPQPLRTEAPPQTVNKPKAKAPRARVAVNKPRSSAWEDYVCKFAPGACEH